MVTDTTRGKYKVIGTRPIRHDGYDKVTGRAIYAAALHLPGRFAGAILRSPPAPAPTQSLHTLGTVLPCISESVGMGLSSWVRLSRVRRPSQTT